MEKDTEQHERGEREQDAPATREESKLVAKWLKRIDKEVKARADFREQAQDSDDVSRDEVKGKKNAFNIHWANNKIIRPAVYANRPKPDVRRRFTQPDPEEKELARLVERSLEYNMDTKDAFDTPSKAVVKDFVHTALGVPRVIYDVTTEPVPDPQDPEILALVQHLQSLGQITPEDVEDALAPTYDQGLDRITSQAVGIEHVPWKHFHWEPGHHEWKNVNWCAIEVFSTSRAIKKEHGVEINSNLDEGKNDRESQKYAEEVQLYEIFDKEKKRIILIARGYDKPIYVQEDALNLEGFYPFPRPAFDNLKSDELIPKPDYCFIKPLIDELNTLTARRARIVKTIKPTRLYDASLSDELSTMESSGDSVSIPVVNLTERLMGATDMSKVIADLPMEDRIVVVRELDAQIESVKQQIYEISGISDIIRGATKASETAAAQSLKGQWANVRLNEKTNEVNRLWRDTMRIMSEIICEHFEPEQLKMMTGIDITPRMAEMMKSDIARSFAIDVETDSTILKDDLDEKQQKLDLVNMLLEKLGFILPLVQQSILPIETVQEILLFIVSSHKHGKQLEDSIQGLGESMANLQNLQQLQQQLQQEQQQAQQAQQQAGQQIQQLQTQLGQFNERKEAREDQKVQIEAQKVGIAGNEKQSESQTDRSRAELDAAKTAQIYNTMSEPDVTVIGIG
jgi:hypothetical protein